MFFIHSVFREFPKYLFLAVMISFVMVSCGSDDGKEDKEDNTVSRTVIVYMVAENTLNNNLPSDVYEMLEGKGYMTDNDCLMLYIDDINLPCIYTVKNSTKETQYTQLVAEKKYNTDVLSTDPSVLREVVTYAINNHPADSYGLILWSHGTGWQSLSTKASANLRKSFGTDNGKNSAYEDSSDPVKGEMSVCDLASALKGLTQFDFIMFDACFMQTIEVAYELRSVTKYIIGSPAETPASGANYNTLMKCMFADEFDPLAMAKAYYDEYKETLYGSLISVVSTSSIGNLYSTTSKYIYNVLKGDDSSLDLSGVQNYFDYDTYGKAMDYTYPDFYDMNSLMKHLLGDNEYKEWKSAFDKVVLKVFSTPSIYSQFVGDNNLDIDQEECGGISMFLPLSKYDNSPFIDSYYDLEWSSIMKK